MTLARQIPGLRLHVHAASEFASDPAGLERCRADIAEADIIIATMLFLEDHFQPLLPALSARRDALRRDGVRDVGGRGHQADPDGPLRHERAASGPMALLKKLRGAKAKTGTAGANQMAMLRRIPKLLRFIPGAAQDVRAYFLTLQYWLAGSEENIANMVRFLVDRYADGPPAPSARRAQIAAPVEYPEVGVYHPRMPGRVSETLDRLPLPAGGAKATIGLLVMRSYVLAGNAGHYDGMIAALEARGLRVIPAFATGLDARPAIEKFFIQDGRRVIDAMVSLMGFSLVGGPAYNDAKAAEKSSPNWTSPISPRIRSSFRRSSNGRDRIAACCRWNRRSWSRFPSLMARPGRRFSWRAQAARLALDASVIASSRDRRAFATCMFAPSGRKCWRPASRS